jgi:competence protein ComEC
LREGRTLLALSALAAGLFALARTPNVNEAPAKAASRYVLPPVASTPRLPTPSPSTRPASASAACGNGRAMTIHFYDVGPGLSALVDLPDGRRVLVDTGDSPRRSGCGDACAAAHRHLLDALRADLGSVPISLLWITHQHSDHIGGAPEIMQTFAIERYVDNGRDARKPEVERAHRAAEADRANIHVVAPAHTSFPIPDGPGIELGAVVPPAWPTSCGHDPNECSIGLRIDFCGSSVLFTGDAEHDEEAAFDLRGPVTLLQVAHHGSETSTRPDFLLKARPKYAVISAGKRDEGINRDYCHPRALVVRRLSQVLGGPSSQSLNVFDGERCDRATDADWTMIPTSDRLWATERDGDVVLTTTGDGVFTRK